MNFDFSDDQKFLKSEARKFLEGRCPTSKVRGVLNDPAKSYDAEVWKEVAAQGWLGTAISEAYGGLGRPFLAHELRVEDPVGDDPESEGPGWRLMRARNKWQTPEDCAHHPYPGTFPVVVTDSSDWGGWRVPGAEYDRDPRRIEFQARLIASAPALRAILRELLEMVVEAPEDAPPALQGLARKTVAIERFLAEVPAPETPGSATHAAE